MGAACALAGSASAQAPALGVQARGLPAGAPPAQWDPTIRQGRLPNGLRYAVQQNANPKGAVSLRLGIDVGSYDEADDERGVAHFVEHMGFNGTRSFTDGKLDATFAPLGVAFGRDHNAATDFRQTIYQIDLPAANAKDLDAAVRWLRDVADGMRFAEPNVVRERGVIQAERVTRTGGFEDLREQMAHFQDGGLRSGMRTPIGTEASIAAMTPARLKSFYDRWYRPENAVVVIVGDLPAEALEQQVRSAFGDWVGRGPTGVRAALTPDAVTRGLELRLAANPRLPAVAAICRMAPPDPLSGSTEARRRTVYLRQVWMTVLQRRITALKSRPDLAFVSADLASEDRPDGHKTCVTILPAAGREAAAIAAISGEIRRFAEQGPTDEEVEVGIEDGRSYLRGAIDGAAHVSKDGADQILETALLGLPRSSPREAFRSFDTLMENVDVASIRQAFARDWSGWGPLVSATTPEPLAESAVRLALADSRATVGPALAAAAPAAPATKWAYNDFGPAGRVVKREEIASPGFVRLRFANGLILNFKHATFDEQGVAVRLRFGKGRQDIAPGDLITAEMASGFFKTGGLGRNTYEEVAERMRGSAWDAKLAIGDQAFLVTADTTVSSLDDQLNLLAAYVSDPGFRPALDPQIAVATDALYRSYHSMPAMLLSETMAEVVSPGQPNNLPSREALAATRSGDFARVLRPLITGSPLEVSIVGDIDEKTAIAAVASSLGALPTRTAKPSGVTPWFMRFPTTTPAPVRVEHLGNREQALVGVYWPLYVANPARRQEEYALLLLAGVMRDQLRHRIRQELGMTYAPEASTRMPDFADQGYLLATVETRPADADLVLKEVLAMAERLSHGEITQAAVDAVRTPMLSRQAAGEASNAWWAALLALSTGDGQGMHELMEQRTRLAAITVDDVKRAATTWLTHPPVIVSVVPTAQGASK
jgi:zinc protease